MNTSSRDAGIPVLTEIIDPAGVDNLAELDPPAAPAARTVQATPAIQPMQPARWPPFQATAAQDSPDEHLGKPARFGATDADWNRLETEVRETVLRHTLNRIDSVLEQRIRDSLADVLQLAVGKLADEIRSSLRQNLEETIAHAVAEEVNILRFPKT